MEAEEEVESLKRKTGEIDFIERTHGRQAGKGGREGMGILGGRQKICVWPAFCAQKRRGCKVGV